MSIIQHKRGRPTRAERIQTRKDLLPYYEQNVPAYKAAQITGYDVKTVNKCYEEFHLAIHGYMVKGLVERSKKLRIHGTMLLDSLIRESSEMLEYVRDSARKLKDAGDIIPSHLIQSHSRIIRDIAHLTEKKAFLILLPDARDMIDEEIKKRIGKNV